MSCSRVNVSLHLGALPSILKTRCASAKESGHVDLFYDLLAALDALCVVKEALQLPTEFVRSTSLLWNGMPSSEQRPSSSSSLQLSRSSPGLAQSLSFSSPSPNASVARSLDRSLRSADSFSWSAQKEPKLEPLTASQSLEQQQLEFSKLRKEHSVSSHHTSALLRFSSLNILSLFIHIFRFYSFP